MAIPPSTPLRLIISIQFLKSAPSSSCSSFSRTWPQISNTIQSPPKSKPTHRISYDCFHDNPLNFHPFLVALLADMSKSPSKPSATFMHLTGLPFRREASEKTAAASRERVPDRQMKNAVSGHSCSSRDSTSSQNAGLGFMRG